MQGIQISLFSILTDFNSVVNLIFIELKIWLYFKQ
jgi:hypothetical protein